MDYKELIVWQRAMDLCDQVYDIADTFPTYELFRMGAQLRGSGLSVPSNIAKEKGG